VPVPVVLPLTVKVPMKLVHANTVVARTADAASADSNPKTMDFFVVVCPPPL
jgi:hypothetical protein